MGQLFNEADPSRVPLQWLKLYHNTMERYQLFSAVSFDFAPFFSATPSHQHPRSAPHRDTLPDTSQQHAPSGPSEHPGQHPPCNRPANSATTWSELKSPIARATCRKTVCTWIQSPSPWYWNHLRYCQTVSPPNARPAYAVSRLEVWCTRLGHDFPC